MPETEQMLIYKSIEGDTGSFGKLVELYQHQIYGLALGMVSHTEDARDITQETFLKAFNSLPHFKYQCGFRTWIYRIASNTCLDYLRRRGREISRRIDRPPDSGRESIENIPSSGPGPEDNVILDEKKSIVRKALLSLPESYRLPLLLQHYQGLSYREISIALNISEKTVATRLYRAKTMLKEYLLGGEDGVVRTGGKETNRPSCRGVHVF